MAILFEKGPRPIQRILLPHDDSDILEQMARARGARKKDAFRPVTDLKQKIRLYFHGNPIESNLRMLDMNNLTGLQQDVLYETSAIPYGSVQSYAQIAARAGRPGAARFVGTTMAINPFPIVIPCHRVVRSSGGLGGYGGGVELKRRLLQLEGLTCAKAGTGWNARSSGKLTDIRKEYGGGRLGDGSQDRYLERTNCVTQGL